MKSGLTREKRLQLWVLVADLAGDRVTRYDDFIAVDQSRRDVLHGVPRKGEGRERTRRCFPMSARALIARLARKEVRQRAPPSFAQPLTEVSGGEAVRSGFEKEVDKGLSDFESKEENDLTE
jgi:hypothetical protein